MVVVPENIKKDHKIILADRKLKLRKIADTLKISEGSVFTILYKNLSTRKLCSKWVPRLFTVDQKQQRVDDSEHVTIDETWIHHYSPKPNRQSAEWTAKGENRPKRPKMQMSAGKVSPSVFWDVRGILFIDYLEKGRNINSEYYVALLFCLKEEIAKKRLQMKMKKVLFHKENAPCH